MAEYFDVLTSIVNKKSVSLEDINKHFVGFMAVKWLSANPTACYIVNHLNSSRGNKFIPKQAEYSFLLNSIKMPKTSRIPFDKTDKDDLLVLSAIAKEFNIGVQSASDYMELLGGSRILHILNKQAMSTNDRELDPRILDLRKAISKKEKIIKNIKGK